LIKSTPNPSSILDRKVSYSYFLVASLNMYISY